LPNTKFFFAGRVQAYGLIKSKAAKEGEKGGELSCRAFHLAPAPQNKRQAVSIGLPQTNAVARA